MIKTAALSPPLVAQALWVAARASRLPEAGGPREGAGRGKRLLVLGDSSAAGVGVNQQSEALAGQLVEALSAGEPVRWKLIAKSGATVRSTLRTLEDCQPEPFDYVIIALGVNDTKNGVRLRRWRDGYRELLERVDTLFDAPLVCVSGLPPLHDFPLLPDPLRSVLGARAAQFDDCLQKLVAKNPRIAHLPVEFPLDASTLASDGFHPGPLVYRVWAERASDVFAELERRGG